MASVSEAIQKGSLDAPWVASLTLAMTEEGTAPGNREGRWYQFPYQGGKGGGACPCKVGRGVVHSLCLGVVE